MTIVPIIYKLIPFRNYVCKFRDVKQNEAYSLYIIAIFRYIYHKQNELRAFKRLCLCIIDHIHIICSSLMVLEHDHHLRDASKYAHEIC